MIGEDRQQLEVVAVASPIGRIGFRLIGMAFAIPSGILVNKALQAGWQRSRGTEPPHDVKAPDNDWRETIIWAGLSTTVVTAVQVAASHGAAATYRALTGREAPGYESGLASAVTTAKTLDTKI